jgi:hypothetical protein
MKEADVRRRQVVKVDQDAVNIAITFLDIVWGRTRGRGYVDLPTRVNGHWNTCTVEWPDQDRTAQVQIESALEMNSDLYFSVAKFKENRRNEDVAMPTPWLWADLDDITPWRCIDLGVCPTIAWESSPDRYQALWLLDRHLPGWLQTQLNHALSRYVGADIGGWDITQVLRPPGTYNHKYAEPWQVELIWHDGLDYTVKRMVSILKSGAGLVLRGRDTRAPAHRAQGDGNVPLPAFSDLPPRARRLLRAEDAVVGERSDRLWELMRLLCEQGLNEDQIFALAWDSVWNKWSSRRDGATRLRREVRKALRAQERKDLVVVTSTNGKVDHNRLGIEEEASAAPWVDYDRFMGMQLDAPPWLIENVWTAHSHGIIGGEPKTAKSLIATAMAISVASGKPFLGEFPVVSSGPVLYVQEENDPLVVRDRMAKIAASYGLIKAQVERTPRTATGKRTEFLEFPESVPIKLLNNWGFDLEKDEHREMLEAEVESMLPAMVVLDPLYCMIGGSNPNNSHEVQPYLKWLRRVRFRYNCAIVVVHHLSKSNENTRGRRWGQRLAGSHIFHGWIESGLYTEAKSVDEVEGPLELMIRREFRNVGPRGPLNLSLEMGEIGDLKFEAQFNEWKVMLAICVREAGEDGIKLREAAQVIGCDPRTAARRCRVEGYAVEKHGKDYRVYES